MSFSGTNKKKNKRTKMGNVKQQQNYERFNDIFSQTMQFIPKQEHIRKRNSLLQTTTTITHTNTFFVRSFLLNSFLCSDFSIFFFYLLRICLIRSNKKNNNDK